MIAASKPASSTFAPACGRERDASRSVVLVGFKNQGNLGLGYLAATLKAGGYDVEVSDIEVPPEDLLAKVRGLNPIVVGFSLIFQFYIEQVETLARLLRKAGVTCHFTIGGHFPSLSPKETFALVPELDTVCRFEGERTLLELCNRIASGQEWGTVEGIAYLRDGELELTALRALIDDLDSLPRPHCAVPTRSLLGHQVAQMLASRGCARECTFCSIHMFYRTPPGRTVRTRRPSEVVAEMRSLFDERRAKIILFQDDDFPMAGKVGHRWARELLQELRRTDLVGRMLWKISCRADAVDPELLMEMRDAGLYMVYMGLESGSEASLRTLGKQSTVQQNEMAVGTLKRLGILFDFGFMMFDPSSTFESIGENISFLRRIVGDGSAPVDFCRMIPYEGTPIRDRLAAEGRLRGNVCNPDYEFSDARVDDFFRQVQDNLVATGWVHSLHALAPQLKFAWHELAVMRGFSPSLPGLDDYARALRRVTRACNETLIKVIENLAAVSRDGGEQTCQPAQLAEQRSSYSEELLRERDAFVLENQDQLLAALDGQPVDFARKRMVPIRWPGRPASKRRSPRRK